MHTPGFTAEASIYRTSSTWRTTSYSPGTAGPQLRPSRLHSILQFGIGWNPGCLFYCLEACGANQGCQLNCYDQCQTRVPIVQPH